MFRRRSSNSESLYRKGVESWSVRDLESAVRHLQSALEASSGPWQDGWWYSASRTLAQVAMEQGDFGTAAAHLRVLSGQGVVDAMQHGLRGKLALAVGDDHMAEINVSAGVGCLISDGENDTGSLMNGAIALMWCGEVLVELGHGREAQRLMSMARDRVRRAGILDPVLDGGLTMVEVGASRLVGDLERARSLLETVDLGLSPDFGFQVNTEKARIAWLEGDMADAERFYSEAVRLCEENSYPAQAIRLELESSVGPPSPRDDPQPVESWQEQSSDRAADQQRPYALVLKLAGTGATDTYLDFVDAVARHLDANPDLGYVDGVGSDGTVWDLFLEGPDPERLWSVVVPMLPAHLLAGSHAEIREGEANTRTVALGT